MAKARIIITRITIIIYPITKLAIYQGLWLHEILYCILCERETKNSTLRWKETPDVRKLLGNIIFLFRGLKGTFYEYLFLR